MPPVRRVNRDRGPERNRQAQHQFRNVSDVYRELVRATNLIRRRARLDEVYWNRGLDKAGRAMNVPLPMDVDHDEL